MWKKNNMKSISQAVRVPLYKMLVSAVDIHINMHICYIYTWSGCKIFLIEGHS